MDIKSAVFSTSRQICCSPFSQLTNHPRIQQRIMCPPGTDQTTRSPQQWSILVPERRQCVTIRTERQYSSPSDYHKRNLQLNLWSMLARPLTSTRKERKQTAHQLSGHCQLLSNELSDMILTYLDDKKDIIALGLSSMHMWERVIGYIEAEYRTATVPWANTQLLFQGSYSTKLPIDEGSAIVKSIAVSGGGRPAARNFYWAHKNFPAPVKAEDQAKEYQEAMESHRQKSSIPPPTWRMLEKDLSESKPSPAGHEWVLRNLTTREVVAPSIMRAVHPDWRLEDLCMSRIRWCAWGHHYNYRGEWAGHRFDMVTREEYLKEAGDWKLLRCGDLEDEPYENLKEWKDHLWMAF